MSITYHERPGVYASYDVSSISTAGSGVKTVAVAAVDAAQGQVYSCTDYTAAKKVFGSGQMRKLLQLLFSNGAQTVMAYPVAEDTPEAFCLAIDALFDAGAPAYLVVGSGSESVQQAAAEKIMEASERKQECIGFTGMEEPTVDALLQRAAALNCERMVLVGQDVALSGETAYSGGWMAAAALAGQLAAQSDPAVPIHNLELNGLSGACLKMSETQLDMLVRGGVTPVEAVGGVVSVVRGITTRTRSGESEDTACRELNTMLIADEVIPAIRNMLSQRFSRCKNNRTTRSAILHQVVLALEQRVRNEIIDGYDELTVAADTEDPTVCRVSFGFTVTHGLSRIYLTAHISV